MKIELDIPIEELWGETADVEINPAMILTDMLLQNAAEKIVFDYYGGSAEDVQAALNAKVASLKNDVINRMEKELLILAYDDIKTRITEKVISDVSEKYERSKVFKEVKEALSLQSDTEISRQIKQLISDIVKSEVRKMIKV
ncbi:MAG: hypothetical protein ACI4KR_09215 [Ruminiclostridium sp.]